MSRKSKMKKICKYALNALLGLLFSIPVITLADSITAMHFVNFKLAEDDSLSVFKEFMKSFKQNFVQSLPFFVLYAGFGGLLIYSWVSLFTSGSDLNMLTAGLLLIATLIFFSFEGVSSYLLSKFVNTTKKLLMISIFVLVKNIDVLVKSSLIEAAMIAVPVLVVCVNPTAVSWTVGIILFFAIMVVYEIFSAKFMLPIFDFLIEQQEKAAKAASEEENEEEKDEKEIDTEETEKQVTEEEE